MKRRLAVPGEEGAELSLQLIPILTPKQLLVDCADIRRLAVPGEEGAE